MTTLDWLPAAVLAAWTIAIVLLMVGQNAAALHFVVLGAAAGVWDVVRNRRRQ